MAAITQTPVPLFFFFFFFFFIFSSFFLSNALPFSSNPKALYLPVSKDATSLQYSTRFSVGTPFLPVNLVLDLGGRLTWINCEIIYKSSSYRPSPCGSPPCLTAKAPVCVDFCFSGPTPVPGCNNNTCNVYVGNTITKTVGQQEVSTDKILLKSSTGSTKKAKGYVKTLTVLSFIFGCPQKWLLDGLTKGSRGMAGLGRTSIGLASQFSSTKFALCMPSSSNSKGIVMFGDPSYTFLPYYNTSKIIDVSDRLYYTKLYLNPVSTAVPFIPDEPLNETSADYFFRISSIEIQGHRLPIKPDLLEINDKGFGGTKISTVNPYTVLESSIYKAFAESFSKQLTGKGFRVPKVAAVKPFTECFNRSALASTLLGPSVPEIRLVLENQRIHWDIEGNNTMVEINKEVVCLGFVDGGENPMTSIVIGAHQIENILLEFNVGASKLGFTNLGYDEIRCENYVI